MRTRLLAILVLILASIPTFEAQRSGADVSSLPVRRVILYKSGVGFFEHVGSVTGAAEVAIQFTTGQLNDVLKSLAAVDLDGGRIANISYNSIAPIEQRLPALRLPLGTNADPLEVYSALRGARVDVRSGVTVTAGRLLGVERRTRTRDGSAEEVDELSLVTDDGSIRTFTLGPGIGIHIGDRDLRDEMSNYLSIVASGRDRDARRMVISTAGTGTRRLLVSYISEVPIWKSTYRLVLAEGETPKPMLQGWAIVDNTIGEDWSNVELSLVAGAPQSFVQDISQPYYARRPVVPLPETMLLQPQTHAPTLTSGPATIGGTVGDRSGAGLPGATVQLLDAAGRVVARAVSDASGEYTLRAEPGAYRLRIYLEGFGSVDRSVSLAGGTMQRLNATLDPGGLSETVTVAAEAAPVDAARAKAIGRGGVAGGVVGGVVGGLPEAPSSPASPAARMAEMTPAATAQDLGDLYEYRLKQPVTILKNQSALVPIVNTEVSAERISLWTRGQGSGRPLRGVWLTNTSGLTLDGGTFSVIDANAFAGEGLIEALKPGEKRLVSYGADLGVVIDGSRQGAPTHFTTVVAHDGILVATQEDRATWTYRIRNEDKTSRVVVIEQPLPRGWSAGKEPATVESSPNAARYRVTVGSKQEATLAVTTRRPTETTFRIGDIDERTIVVLAQGGAPEPELRRALQPVLAKRSELASVEARMAAINTELAAIAQDQQRVRENMKALRGSAEEKALLQRYTRELNAEEDRLSSLQADLKNLTAERDTHRTELARLAAQLSFTLGT